MFVALLRTLYLALDIYTYFLFAYIIFGWLIFFDIVNRHNRFVYITHDFFSRLIEPVLDRIRSVLPSFGPIDISPIILGLGIFFIKQLIVEAIIR